MSIARKIYMSDMRVVKSPDISGNRFFNESEEQFKKSGSHFYQAIENADGVPFHLVFGTEVGEGHYVSVGEGIRQLIGIAPKDFTEKLFQSMIEEIAPLSDDIPSDLAESREKFIRGEIKRYKAEVLVRTPGGEKKWIRDSSLPVIDEESGKVIGSFGILFDVSEHKQSLAHLKRAHEEAEESNRLKTAFLQNISHELRTPLNAIVGFSTLLCTPGQEQKEREEFLDIINNSTDHLLEVFEGIVEISIIEANAVKITKKEVSLNSIISKVYARLILKADEKNIIFCRNAPANEGDVIIMTDSFKLQQALTNLVGNAIKFTIDGKVEFGYKLKDDRVEFYVSDTGIGIPPEVQPLIFSRLYQVDNSNTRRFEGTGLGLAISKAYVELLGGIIWFTSRPGATTFYFTLPQIRAGGQISDL